jgi:hypothetical protein
MTDRHDELRVGDEEFLGMARDPAIARLLSKKLDELAQGKSGEILGEMAREVLSGRLDLREAVRVGAYEQELVLNIDEAQKNLDRMSSEEKMQAEKEGAKILQQCQEEIDQEQREKSKPGGKGRHGADGWSLY